MNKKCVLALFFSLYFSFYAIFSETAALRYPLSSCGALDIPGHAQTPYEKYLIRCFPVLVICPNRNNQ